MPIIILQPQPQASHLFMSTIGLTLGQIGQQMQKLEAQHTKPISVALQTSMIIVTLPKKQLEVTWADTTIRIRQIYLYMW
jgi:hypothetical protein